MQKPADQFPQNKKRRPRRSAFMRLARGYLMLVGAGTTVYGLIRLLVWLLVIWQN